MPGDRIAWPSRILFLIAAGILAWQVLLPGFIGLANNGDFVKVAGRSCIGGDDNGADNFVYFKSDYSRGPSHCVVYGPPSSEEFLTRIASGVERLSGNPNSFDIRWLGALHAALWLAGYALLLWSLRPAVFWAAGAIFWVAGAVSLWIFADVTYISYLNTFFTDTTALLGMMAAIPAALLLLSEESPRPVALAMFGAGGLLMATSKGQHAAAGMVLAAFVAMVCWRSRARMAACGVALVLLAGSVWSLAVTPAWLSGNARFNLIFFKLLPDSANPQRDAAELGLPARDLRYVGLNAYSPNSPTNDPAWMQEFLRGSYSSVARFYLHHPERAFGFLWQDLNEEAWRLRAPNLSNYRRQDGHPAGAITHRMASWSDLQSWALEHRPELLILWYALAIFLTPVLAWREGSRFRAGLLWTLWLAAGTGLVEYGVASLVDSIETFRHLLLFHLLTDFTLFFGLLWALTPRRFYRERSTAG